MAQTMHEGEPISPPADAAGFVPLPGAIDLRRTLGPLAHGRGDPTIRFEADRIWRATRTPDGPATIRLRERGGGVEVVAWGAGAERAVADAADLVGANDRPEALVPHHPLVAELVHRLPGLRLPRTNRPFEALLPAICEQKVTGIEARAAFRGLVRAHGDDASGPSHLRLRLPPQASVLAGLPYFAYHPFGLERRRAEVLINAARLAPRLEGLPAPEAYRLMAAVPGIGPWTMAEVGLVAYGDPDALSVGDFHLPNLVAWALAGEPRADDARMLALLEPYRGQRGRVQRLLEAADMRVPRYGPRLAPRDMRSI